MVYAYSENFVMPLSHDEVVHGKGSMADQMPGDGWQRMANLRLLYGYMYGMPGKKLLFMGDEWGQWQEWRHDASLDWHQRNFEPHAGLERWVGDLNALYKAEPPLHRGDCTPGGFDWVDCTDAAASVYTFLRRADDGSCVLVVCNFTPVMREGYRVGVPHGGYWRELLNSDATSYWGGGQGNAGGSWGEMVPWNGRPFSLNLRLPPLGVLFFKT